VEYFFAFFFAKKQKMIRQDIEAKGLNEGILLDTNEWKKLIHVPDLT